jgi:hypothetical protein
MRFRLPALLLVFVCSASAQTPPPWKDVSTAPVSRNLDPATLSAAQRSSLASLLRRHLGGWECGGEDFRQLIEGLSFDQLPLAPGANAVLVSSGSGCARGGQGANGALWVVRFYGVHPVLLASPDNQFSGWLYSVQPSSGHGYRDIILGWHMSAAEAGLTWFRFDGKAYQPIGSASLLSDDGENLRIVPKQP